MSKSLFISELRCGPFMNLRWAYFPFTLDLLLFPAFSSRLGGQPKAHQACHLFWASLSFGVIEVVESQVLSGGGQQAKVGLGGVERLLLCTTIPLTCHLDRGDRHHSSCEHKRYGGLPTTFSHRGRAISQTNAITSINYVSINCVKLPVREI